MDKKIKQAAMKFYKSAGKKPTVQNVVSALQKLGYDVVLFNTPEGDEFIESLGLEVTKERTKAFTTGGAVRFVFLDNDISASEKLYALLHEAGHIMLGHIGNGTIEWRDNTEMEIAANAFAAEVLSPTSAVSTSAVIIIVIAILMSSGLGYCLHRPETVTVFNEQPTVNAVARTDDIVYITSSGEKYHSLNCIYTKDKNCAMIDKQQAQRIFGPCSVCNP